MNNIQINIDDIHRERILAGTLAERDLMIEMMVNQINELNEKIKELEKPKEPKKPKK